VIKFSRMKKYNFIKFQGNYYRGDERIGINKSGLIRLSSGFCRTTNAKSFKYVILFYDMSNKAIAFKFTNHPEDGALKVVQDDTAAAVSSKAFMKANKLNLSEWAGRYDWKPLNIKEIGNVYVINQGDKK
jgi:hypothetical protein